MRKVKLLFMAMLLTASLAVMSSCGSKSKSEIVLDEFETLVEEVEANKGKLSADELEKMHNDFNKRFEALGIEEIDEKEFSAMEKIKLIGLTARWAAAMAESSPALIEDAIEDAKAKEAAKTYSDTATEATTEE